MKQLWTSGKKEGALIAVVVALAAAIFASIIYYSNYTTLVNYPHIPYEIGFLYGAFITIFVLHLLPILITEYKINFKLNEQGYSLAKDQNVIVSFNQNGTLIKICYQNTTYINDTKYGKLYQIFSEPAYYNPQLHTIYVAQFPTENFAVLTERLPSGRIISTVYIFSSSK